jgi:hypothetical protein
MAYSKLKLKSNGNKEPPCFKPSFNAFPFFLNYMTNAKYMISSWPVALKFTLIISSYFLCIWS